MSATSLGRNSTCPCGSGRKDKKCCLARASAMPPRPTGRNGEHLGFVQTPAQMAAARDRAAIPLPKGSPPASPAYWAHPPGQPDAAPPAGGEWVEYVFVKDKGWTHERDLKPGDQYRLKCGGWETVLPEKVIRTTHEHPFYVQGKGWTPAGEIRPGDVVRTEDGWVPVTESKDTGKWETVYNLRVADYHTYFVGAPEWGFAVWAHNASNHYISELGTEQATRAHRNNSRGMRDAVEHAINGDPVQFQRALAADGITDAATVKRLWDAARQPLDAVPGELARVGPGGRLRVTVGVEELGDPAGSVRITHPTGDDVVVAVRPDGAARVEVGFVNSRGTHNELLAAGVDLANHRGATSLTYNSGPLNERSGPLLTAFYDRGRPYLGGGPLRRVSDTPLVYESDMSALLGR